MKITKVETFLEVHVYFVFSVRCYTVNCVRYVTKYYVIKDNPKWESHFVTLIISLAIVELMYYIYHF